MGLPRPIGGKVVVITGAARGIGEQLALRLAGRGARLALVGLEPERLADVARRCGAGAAWWECDVTDGPDLQRVAAEVKERFHRVDVLVANAGIAVSTTLLAADPESYDRVIEVNLLGSVRTARAFMPHLVAAQGYYLQIASLAAMAPAPMMGSYCASKAGVEAFAQVIRTEVACHGVSVGVAYLSFTETDMTAGAVVVPEVDRLRDRLPGPLARLNELGPAITRIVNGIERRSPRVYGQSFIRYIPPARWLIPSASYLTGRAHVAGVEQAILREGPEAALPAGAGGRADLAARQAATDTPGRDR
jgi:NAD(P)-dependent dehydrogenase (short-subunit alcohol dehydrogenase family)